MRYLSAGLLLIFLFAACSPTESIQEETVPGEEEEIPAPEEEVTETPDWYDGQVFSKADSVSFFGFSMASSSDSSEAAELSVETALQNLRFEIDRHAENTRILLVEEDADGEYSQPGFIVNLRNAVREMELDVYELNHEHEESDTGVHYVYTRAVLDRDQLPGIFESHLADERFLEKLQELE
ncbi:MAG: hypothetical protein JJU13_08765 [Balneolaceae bacterium]|nr:hypothetical protein [Balneolaceae bacterium]